jgi:ribonuclease HI
MGDFSKTPSDSFEKGKKMAVDDKKSVTIYTDGGCEPNPGPGAWAAVLLCGKTRKEICGTDPDTTNNRMELTAALQGLLTLKKRCQVVLFTDSEYLKKGITEWLPLWKRRNWTRKGGELKNVDLWQELDEMVQKHDVEWRWVRGHVGIRENERCDEMVSQAIKSFRKSNVKYKIYN